jgi:HK97 family phage portal protein
MGLGRLVAGGEVRSTQITTRDTITNATATYFIQDNLGPDWATSSAYRGGMSIPGAWRAAKLRAGLLGMVPWHAYRQLPNRPEERITPTPPLLRQPNPPDTRLTTFGGTALDLIWHGNGIWVIASRDRTGWPTAVVPVPARSVGVRRITEYADSPLPIGALEYSIGRMRLGSRDVIHFKGTCEPGAERGMGVLEQHLSTLNLAQEQSRQASSISRHGVPTGVLTTTNPDASQKDMLDAKTAWLESQRDRTIAALGPTVAFTPLSWNPEQLQMVEARKFTLSELELIFEMPVGFLGGMTSSRSYANIEQDATNLVKFPGVGSDVAQFEQTLSLSFPPETEARANLDAILRADTLTRYQAHQIALGGKPWMNVDEVREYEHRPPMAVADDSGYEYAS